ncbi:glycosyltransferase [Mammaliicoccus vitulinus]|uniref:glycosyltransferase n=1 Tax=Mammaliicoccus vitulinus TaxID=71237 RepID=UPI0028D1A736|nr:glycosyltransferase [Mammaliicoccus vitulinus]
MRFTIAIPSYNSEQYIKELLDSLVKQTFDKENFEVIIVDDCSSDNTVNIAESYKSKLNINIHVLDKNSGGPGKPRNKAISNARGEFIFFVDSDDYINKDTLKNVDEFINEKYADVILVKMQGVNGRGVPKSMFSETCKSVRMDDSRILYTLSPTKFYNTALLRKNNIYFPEELKSAEDQLFTIKAYIFAENISILADQPYYYATKRDGEHMSSAYVNPADFYTIMKNIVQEVKNSSLENKNTILSLFIDRHFNFSRTKNFSLNINENEVSTWMNSLSDFINEIPEEVDELVNPSLVPLLKYARAKDFNNYQIVEKSYKNNSFENIKFENNKALVQFISEGQYFDVSNLNNPDIKMTDFKFDNNEFKVRIQLTKSIVNPLEMLSSVNIKLVSRNKKEKIIIPLSLADKDNYTFTCELDKFIEYGIKEKVWDLFFEAKINEIKVEKRIGKNRVKYNYEPETSTLVNYNNKIYRFTPYFTKDFDNLSFYITPIETKDEFHCNVISNDNIEISAKNRSYIFSNKIVNINYKNENILGFIESTADTSKYNLQLYSKIKKPIFKNNLDFTFDKNSIYLK